MKITTGYKKDIGMIAWLLQMIAGVVLIFYVLAHGVIVGLLFYSEKTFEAVIRLLHMPVILLIEMIVLLAILFHTLNGIRILFFDLGLWIGDQRDIAYTVIVAVFILFLFHFIPLFEQFTGIVLF